MAGTKEGTVCDVFEKSTDRLKTSVVINQGHSLPLPPQYNGSNMFMPTGERLYWQAEVVPSTFGLKTCQDFEEIRIQCLANGELFVDPEFSPSDQLSKSTVWLRPGEIVKKPQLFLEGISRFDVNQGHNIADCWMDSVLAALTMHKNLFDRVVPSDQSFHKDYAGVFHFRFWQYGRWVDVVIDDRLPTKEGKLILLHSSHQNEFWSALLEKAYAKLHGSYEALNYGLLSEAQEDFTGGVTDYFDVSEPPNNFFNILLEAYERNSIITTGMLKFYRDMRGLFNRHAYTITCVKQLDPETPLLRIRDPYGKFEWKGPWSDDSFEWDLVPKDKADGLEFDVKDDGEFWMSFEDFTKYFSSVSICNLNPESLYPEEFSDRCNVKWEMSMFEGEWVKCETAGGSETEKNWCNPHIHISLTDPDERDEEETCTVLISLLQKFKRNKFDKDFNGIGFVVYKFDEDISENLDEAFFREHTPVFETKRWLPMRGVGAKLKLPVGRYLIVPSTSDADEEGQFLLRVISEKQRDATPPPQVILV